MGLYKNAQKLQRMGARENLKIISAKRNLLV
jgi:hypothetical protein